MDVPKTLDDVRAAKGVFPADEIEPGDVVLDLMCAGFYGANAAIHVLDREPGEYFGVDLDAAKLGVMRDLYPAPRCKFVSADVSLFVAGSQGDGSDVVICDPWTQDIDRWMLRLDELLSMADRVLILGVSHRWFEAHGVPETVEGLNEWAGDAPLLCRRLIRRSDHLGGTFWTVWR